jgi:serine/threonine protein kinase
MKQNAPGQVVLEHYRLTRYLGRGGAGEVWEALGPGDIPKAVKIAPIRDESDDLATRELDGLRKMRTLNHPFLLHIERFESVDDNLIVVMELAESSLKDRYAECLKAGDKGISRTELLRYLKEAAEALDYLRVRHGLQHLDVKPGNLFLSSGHLKVADYGLVHPHSTKAPTCTFALSPHYAPPELFDGDIEPTADQYSLAVTYQELLTGTRPYTGSSVRELLTAHYRSKPDLAALPATDRRVIAQALERDPTKRHESCMALIDQLRKSSSFSFVERPPTPAGALNGLKVIDSQLSTTPPATQSNAATVSVEVAGAEADKAGEGSGVIKPPEQRYSSTFLAFLPLQIYAHKLRGFIDELDAEMVSCSDERALLRFTKRNWFGKRILKDALFLQIDACCHNPGSGYRVIEAVVWTANQEWSSDRLRRKSDLLLKLLRCYLIAADKGDAGRAVAKAKTELLV